MNPSFTSCAFKLHLPVCIHFDGFVRVDLTFEYRKGNTEKIVYERAVITDKVNVKHTNEAACFFAKTKCPLKIQFTPSEGKKIFIKGSTLQLFFLSDCGERTEVKYVFVATDKATLLDVSKCTMTAPEKKRYIEVISMSYSKEPDPPIDEPVPDNPVHSSTNVTHNDFPGLKKYRDALKTERAFLANGGGKKYKVTNGKLISERKGIYSYIFDLETELHIADDAPIKITTSASLNASGSVLMCEDFQIIVLLESNIGDRIGSATISVEPWKLLDAIEERLQYGIDINGNEIASELLKTGPSLATKDPIEAVPKGQDIVLSRIKTDPVCVVWGPPGTGKTQTMSEAAIQFMGEGKKVLIVSHSNVSVDGVAKRIYKLLKDTDIDLLSNGKVLRYGYVRDQDLSQNPYVNSFYFSVTKNPSLNNKLDALLEEYDQIKHTKGLGTQKIIDIKKEINKIRSLIREQEQNYVGKASIVATTISKVIIDKLFKEKLYDVVMFDEVSMAYVPQIVCAATFCKEHLICVGDFMQLAPIAQSPAKDILCEDIFSYLGINQYGTPHYHPWLVMLDEQHRMHPDISGFSNQYIYKKLLKDHPSMALERAGIVREELFKGHPINLVSLDGSYCAAYKNADNSRFNVLSGFISFAAAVITEPNVETVSIITPYAAQTRLVHAMILDYREHGETALRCSTVHQFQGSESDVIFFDAVESYPAKKTGYLMGKDFNSIKRLINVAVTRAKGKLVCVANFKFWNNHYEGTTHTLYKLLGYLTKKGSVIQQVPDKGLQKLVQGLTIKGGPEFYLYPHDYLSLFGKDISEAKKKIVISLPSGELDHKYAGTIIMWIKEAKERGVKVLIKCNDYGKLPKEWMSFTWGTENAIFPIVMIDERITWYDAIPSNLIFKDGNNGYKTICPITVRTRGKHTAEMVRSLSDLESREINGKKTSFLEKQNGSDTDPYETSGLGAYIKKTKKCPTCGTALVMTKGKSGKTILWCNKCKKTHLLKPDEVNHYMLVHHVVCKKHNCQMEAKLSSSYGVYIKCDSGCFIKPEEI